VKRRGLSVVFFLFGVALAAQSSETQPVSSVQLMAWLAAGVPNPRLVRIIQERGLANAPDKDQVRQFEAAGADTNLLRTLTSLKSSTSNSGVEIPGSLLQAAADAKAQRFHEAELALRPAVRSDPQNAALHFALGGMLIRQERWDDAFD